MKKELKEEYYIGLISWGIKCIVFITNNATYPKFFIPKNYPKWCGIYQLVGEIIQLIHLDIVNNYQPLN